MARKNGGNFSARSGVVISRDVSTPAVQPSGSTEVVVSGASDLGLRYGCKIANMRDQCECAFGGGHARRPCPSAAADRPGLPEAVRMVSTVAPPLLWTQIRGTVRWICERVRQITSCVYECRILDGIVRRMMGNYFGEKYLRQTRQKRETLRATMVPWRIKQRNVVLTAHNHKMKAFVTTTHAHPWQEFQFVLLPTTSMPQKKLNKEAVRKVMRDTVKQVEETARDKERGGNNTPNPHGGVAAAARRQNEKEKMQKEQEKQWAAEEAAQLEQLATEMQETLQILETGGMEHRPPRTPPSPETVVLLQSCTSNLQQTTMVAALDDLTMATAQAVCAENGYKKTAMMFMQYHTATNGKGQVFLELVPGPGLAPDLHANQVLLAMEEKGYQVSEVRRVGKDGQPQRVTLDKPFKTMEVEPPAPTFAVRMKAMPDRGLELLQSAYIKLDMGGENDKEEFRISFVYGDEVTVNVDLQNTGNSGILAWVAGMTGLRLTHTEFENMMRYQLTKNLPDDLKDKVAAVTISRERVFRGQSTLLTPQSIATKRPPHVVLAVPDEQARQEITKVATATLTYGLVESQVGFVARSEQQEIGVGLGAALDRMQAALDARAEAPKNYVQEAQKWLEKDAEERAAGGSGIEVNFFLNLLFTDTDRLCLPNAKTQLKELHAAMLELVTDAKSRDTSDLDLVHEGWERVRVRLEEGSHQVQVDEEIVRVHITRSDGKGGVGKMPTPLELGLGGGGRPSQGSVRAGLKALFTDNDIEMLEVDVVYVLSPPAVGSKPWVGPDSYIVASLGTTQFEDLKKQMQPDNTITLSPKDGPTDKNSRTYRFHVSQKVGKRMTGASQEDLELLKEKMMECLNELHAFAVPNTLDDSQEGGRLVGQQTKLSEMHEGKAQGVWDIRSLGSRFEEVPPAALEVIMKVIYDMREKKIVEFVEASNNSLTILVMLKGLALEIQTQHAIVDWQRVSNGEDNRAIFEDALRYNLLQLIRKESQYGFWIEQEVLECAISGYCVDDGAVGDDMEEVQERPSWWTQLLGEHPLTQVKNGEHVKGIIKDILNESAANRAVDQGLVSGGGWNLVAVAKKGYMVVTVSGPYVLAIMHAEKAQGVTPGQRIDFNLLPNQDEEAAAFDEKVATTLRAKRLVWVIGATLTQTGELSFNMEDQQSEHIDPRLPSLDKTDQRFEKGRSMERALNRLKDTEQLAGVQYPEGMMLIAPGPTTEHGTEFLVEAECRLNTVAKMVKPFGTPKAKGDLELMSKSKLVDRIADLGEAADPYIIIGAELQSTDRGVKIVKTETVVLPTEAMKVMQLIEFIRHPMLNTAEGLDELAAEGDLLFAQVQDGVVAFSTRMNPKWGTLENGRAGFKGWDPKSGWTGLQEWASKTAEAEAQMTVEELPAAPGLMGAETVADDDGEKREAKKGGGRGGEGDKGRDRSRSRNRSRSRDRSRSRSGGRGGGGRRSGGGGGRTAPRSAKVATGAAGAEDGTGAVNTIK